MLQCYVQDFQALDIFLARYRAAVTPPEARKPDTACLALEIITVRRRTLCTHLAASSLDPIVISRTT